MSYAWCDSSKVDKVDQWLRNYGVRVLRDREVFVAGSSLDENTQFAVAPAAAVEYTRNHRMEPPDPPSCYRSPNWRPGWSRKGLGDRPAPVHPPHHPRDRTGSGSMGAAGWRSAVSFNQVLPESRRDTGADRTFCEPSDGAFFVQRLFP